MNDINDPYISRYEPNIVAIQCCLLNCLVKHDGYELPRDGDLTPIAFDRVVDAITQSANDLCADMASEGTIHNYEVAVTVQHSGDISRYGVLVECRVAFPDMCTHDEVTFRGVVTPDIDHKSDRSPVLIKRLEDGLIPILSDGHHGCKTESVTLSDTWFSNTEYTREYLMGGTTLMMLESSDTMTKWVNGETTEPIRVGESLHCDSCGVSISPMFDGKQITFYTVENQRFIPVSKCKFPGGRNHATVHIRVPSGRIIFANDLRSLLPRVPDFNINTTFGMLQESEAVASSNALTAFVGNTCPSVIQSSDLSVHIVTGSFDDNTYPVAGTLLGSICTDLWWFYGMDGDDFDNANTNILPEAVAYVEPGEYAMTLNIKKGDTDDSGGYVYASIHKVGEL